MALNPRLELRAQQRIALTPELRARLHMLRLPPAELAEELAREAARNPFLLFDPGSAPAARATETPEAADLLQARAAPFQDDLRRQIDRMGLPPLIAAAALLLIAELRADGFLDVALEDLAEERGLSTELLDEGLAALQRCEPAGIAARSVAECLLLQLLDRGLPRPAAQATVEALPLFVRQDWKRVGAALGLDPAAVRERAALLRGLSPRPLTPEAEDTTPAAPLIAELRLVRGAEGAVSVVPVEGRARPALRLDQAMVRRATTEGFAPDLLQRARALIAALDQRGRTLTRIGEWLAQKQAGFFARGSAGLVPASRQDLAADLGLHPSTVGRALAGKAIDIDGRLWPLSVFFSAALAGAEGPVAARAVQRRIAELVAAEPAGQPLSDDALAGLLREQGVDIARRTVAKYRQGLRIPPSSTRRRQAVSRRGE